MPEEHNSVVVADIKMPFGSITFGISNMIFGGVV